MSGIRRTTRRFFGVPGSHLCSLVQRARARVGDDAGFTMVETIVSFTIFAIVSAAAALSVVAGVDANNTTSDRVVAVQLAQQATDQARALSKSALAATPTTVTTQVVGNKKYPVARTVTAVGGSCPTTLPARSDHTVHKMTVTVVVTIPGGGRRAVRIDSVIAC